MGSGDPRHVRTNVPRPSGARTALPARSGTLEKPKDARPDASAAPAAPAASPATQRSVAEPTVLVVGADDVFLPALRIALARHHVYVETALSADAVETVIVTAPDLVLLVGEAARGSGDILKALSSSKVSSVVPVALLHDETGLETRLDAFRHGAAAVIPRSASVDAIAEHVAKVAREIPDRGAALGVIGESTLEEFVDTLHSQLRSGILSVKTEADAPVRLVLGGGRPLAAFIDEFVQRVRRHVVRAEALEYEFDDRAPGSVKLLASVAPGAEAPSSSIGGLRIVLADQDPVRIDVVAQELRARGATVLVSDFNPDAAHFARIRQVDPEVLMLGEAELEGPGYTLYERTKQDTRLRWASLLVVRWHEIWENALALPSIEQLRGALAELGEPERGLADRIAIGDTFDTRLEVTGPARCLRALTESKRTLRVSIYNARVTVELDLSDGLVVGATARNDSGERWEGAHALAAFLVLGSGRVHVEPVTQPATTNMMATVDVALSLAEHEVSPIEPSLHPVGGTHAPPSVAPSPSEPVRLEAVVDSAVVVSPIIVPVGSEEPTLRAVIDAAPPVRKTTTLLGIGPGESQSSPASPRVSLRLRRGLESTGSKLGALGHLVTGAVRQLGRKRLLIGSASLALGFLVSVLLVWLSRGSSSEPVAVKAVAAQPSSSPVAAPPPPVEEARTRPAEAHVETPSCDELLANVKERGSFRGAAYQQLALARRALVRGDVDAAQRAYCTAVRWDAANATHYLELANLLLLRKDAKAAADWAERGVRLEPGSPRGQSLLGDALARLDDEEGAKRAWFAASRLVNPTPTQIHDLARRSLEEAGRALARHDLARAGRFFRRCVVLDPEDPAGLAGLATVLLRSGEPEPARYWAERANQIAPKDPRALIALGDVFAADRDTPRAREFYTAAVALGDASAAKRLERLE